jgi:type II secretory pathway component HofQ
MGKTVLHRVCFLLLLTLHPFTLASERHLEIIPLQHRPAETLIPVLMPLTSGETSLSASGNNLIIRATPSELLQLKTLIEEIDQPLAQFRIYVRTGNQSNITQQEYGVGHQGSNFSSTPTIKRSISRNGVIIQNETRHSSSKVVVHRSSTLSSNHSQQQVRATEGYPAYISIGEEIPVTNLTFWDGSDSIVVGKKYKPVVSGFYVTPQLSAADNVVLSLSTQQQSLKNNRRINTQGYTGTLRGRLGEWIQVGGVGQQDRDRENDLNRHYSSKLSNTGNIYLKVERIQ